MTQMSETTLADACRSVHRHLLDGWEILIRKRDSVWAKVTEDDKGHTVCRTEPITPPEGIVIDMIDGEHLK